MMGGLLYVARYDVGGYSIEAGLERLEAVDMPPRPLRKVVPQ